MTDSVTAVAALVRKLARRVDGLAADVAKVAESVQARATGEAKAAAPVWFGLSKDEYSTQLQMLTAFVDQHLRVTYGDYLGDVLHDCWAQHRGALWELGNLKAEWDRVYGQDPPSLTGALAWHDRWLPGVKGRLAETMRGCREDRCSKAAPVRVNGWAGAR